MLLKITYKGSNATDLGYLLHKNPNRSQEFELSFGKAYVFYPQADEHVTTVALLLDINPIDLARGKLGSKDGGLFDYINDRPYVSSSFLSTAIAKVFSSAMSGKCDKCPELVLEKIDLTAQIIMLPCSSGVELIEKAFKPLGYDIEYKTYVLDNKFPKWGDSNYLDLTLKANIRLSELLNHLYVLIPIFDKRKHYWIADDEVKKLINHGEGWLSSHPYKNIITKRYLNQKKSLIDSALTNLVDDEDDEVINHELNNKKENKLNDLRINAVTNIIHNSEVKSLIDLGCGEGRLIKRLLENRKIDKITGVDVSVHTLAIANSRLKLDRISLNDKVSLIQGSLTYKDKRFLGYDAACIIEVIEHLDLARLSAFQRVVFEYASPKLVIITTPNAEYNVKYEKMHENTLRHDDHRFEWTRNEFQAWANSICKQYGYCVEFDDIGEYDEKCGSPTQMGVFRK